MLLLLLLYCHFHRYHPMVAMRMIATTTTMMPWWVCCWLNLVVFLPKRFRVSEVRGPEISRLLLISVWLFVLTIGLGLHRPEHPMTRVDVITKVTGGGATVLRDKVE